MTEHRGTWPRVGISALNLLAPGLGLLRTQRLNAAAFFLVAYPATGFATASLFGASRHLDFGDWIAIVALVLAATLMLLVASIVFTWRTSRERPANSPRWSRWYGLLAAWLIWVGAVLLTPDLTTYYRSFYLPAEAMTPTLLQNDRIVASMRPGPLRRGDIILFNVGDSVYIKRVAALPGDSIEMVDGMVLLNGRPVAQRFVRTDIVQTWSGQDRVRRLAEQFPGEARPHEIYDSGYFPYDDFPEQRVRPGHVFVLGDNRDHSADSRVSRDAMGVEQLPLADVIGTARFIYWRPGGGLVGTSLSQD